MYHYQQVKCKTKTEVDQYMRIIQKYSAEKSKRKLNKKEKVGPDKKHDPLAEDDPRRHQSDEEILYEKIDLSDSALSRNEKNKTKEIVNEIQGSI